jgi:RNA polymerase sigma factor (sigma-70 family)
LQQVICMFQAFEIVNRVVAARAGEMAAWNGLYQYYYPRLLNTALQFCGNRPETKDLVQDTFITAFLKLSQLKDPAHFGAWIGKILVRKCYRVSSAFEPLSETTDSYDREEQLEYAERQTRLQTAISNLPENLRATLLLRYFSGRQSYNEIAEILLVPVGTVRSRLNEAKTKLLANWHESVDGASQLVKESEGWNQFYRETLSGLHFNAEQRRIFLAHVQKDSTIIAPGNHQIPNGRDFFANLVANDQECGSWLKPVDIISSGNVTVVDQAHFNSPEHPDHCPPSCVVIIYRKTGIAAGFKIYAAQR